MTDKNNLPVLLAVTLSAFLTPFMGSALNVALPLIGKEFSMTALALSWVTSAFLLAAAITLVPVGRLSDIYGRRKIFLYGALVFTVSSSFCVWSPNSNILIFLRVVQGIGGAMIFSTGTALLISDYPINKHGRILGINLAAVYTGLTFGPFVGGLLTEHFGWRYIFLFSTLLGVIMTLIIARLVSQEKPVAKGETFDFAGSLMYGLSLFAVMYGFSLLPAPAATIFILFGIICLIGFIMRQLKIPFPLLDIRLFADNRVFAFSNMAALINYCATFAVTFLLSIYLQQVKMLSPAQAGLVLVAEPIVLAVCSPFAGRLSDRFEPQLIASAGMALTVIGLVLLIFITEKTSLHYIIACLILLGVGFAFFSSPNVNATMSAVGNKFYGIASATLATMRITGQMFSMGITMLVFAFVLGQQTIAAADNLLLIESARIIYFILAVICVCGVFFSAARGKVHK